MVNSHKKGKILRKTAVPLIVLVLNFCAFSYDFAGGTGEPNDPYQIETAEQLLFIGTDPNLLDKNFILINDINLNPNLPGGKVFEDSLIAPDINDANFFWQGTPFSGCFDGNNHIITNLVINADDKNYIGLFGYIVYGQVKNLCIEDFYVCGYSGVGGLAGISVFSTITSCYTSGKVVNYWLCCGGLIGATRDVNITNCGTRGDITGYSYLGGLIGDNGYNTIDNCYADCFVNGNMYVGGLIGINYSGIISNCYSTGLVTIAAQYSGGLIGRDSSGTMTACFWDVENSGTTDGVGNKDPDPNGVYGRTTEQMQTLTTFTDYGWDFENIWAICEGTNYPKLQWQIPLADLLCPDGVNFLDFAFFSDYWLETGCADSNGCDGTDFDLSGQVDSRDLKIFIDCWLGKLEIEG